MTMQIGFSSFILQGGQTGIATYILNLIANLQQLDGENRYKILVPENDQHHFSLTNKNFDLHTVASYLGKPVPSICWHNTVLPRLCSRENIDILHVPSYRRIPFIKRSKLVATVHDLAPYAVKGKYDLARSLYHQMFIPSLVHGCDHVIAVSHNTKNDIMRFLGYPDEKISVIYPGVNHALYRRLPAGESEEHLKEHFGLDAPFIVYVSRVEHPGKNHVELIHAFNTVKERTGCPHKLVIAGAFWSGSDYVKGVAKDTRYSDDIQFLGFVSNDDIVALYNACDLMVHPSLYEGFGFPIIEALACGAQVVCSGNSSMRELGEGRLRLFDPRSRSEIANAIQEGIESQLAENTRKELMAYASSFEWKSSAEQVLRVYNKL